MIDMSQRAFFVFCFFLVTIFASLQSVSANQVKLSSAPAWADAYDVSDLDAGFSDQHRDGVAWLLDDTQWNWDGRTQTLYFRYLIEVVNREGLEYAASIDVEFDPQTDDLAFHTIRIIREGKETDVIGDIDLEILRREEDLEDGIVDGRLTAHGNIKGVQVGDRIEVAYSLTEARPIFEPSLGFVEYLEYSSPVAAKRIRLRVPNKTPLLHAAHAIEVQPDIKRTEDHEVYVWMLTNSDAIPGEDERPGEFPLWGYVEVSGWLDWQAVRDAVISDYRPQSVLPADYREKIDAIRKSAEDPAVQMGKALQLVQDEIRYVSVDLGEGGFVPRQPGLVIEHGYGDCKDKSLLLAAILRNLGINASVALVNTRTGFGLANRLPSPFRFNHAIVRAEIDGEIFWLEPTWTLSGGTGREIAQPDYGFALVLSPNAKGLERIEPPLPTRSAVQISENYWLPNNPDNPVLFEIKSVFRDGDADYMRRKFSRTGKVEMSRRYAAYYEKRYPGLEIGKRLKVVDDFDTNEFRIYESYRLSVSDFSQADTVTDFTMRASSLYRPLPTPSGFERKSPIELGRPKTYEHSIKITDPLGTFADEENVDIETDAFTYRRTTPEFGNTIWYRWQLDIKKRIVPAEQVKTYLRSAKSAKSENFISYDLTSYLNNLNESTASGSSSSEFRDNFCEGFWKFLPFCPSN